MTKTEMRSQKLKINNNLGLLVQAKSVNSVWRACMPIKTVSGGKDFVEQEGHRDGRRCRSQMTARGYSDRLDDDGLVCSVEPYRGGSCIEGGAR